MTQDNTPFDHRPDPVLGSALRQALAPGDESAFVAALMGSAERAGAASWDAVLARWARVGVAAAVIVVLVAGYVMRRSPATAASRLAPVADALLTPAAQGAELDVVLTSVMDD